MKNTQYTSNESILNKIFSVLLSLNVVNDQMLANHKFSLVYGKFLGESRNNERMLSLKIALASASHISKLFDKADVRHAFIKGFCADFKYYGFCGDREFVDIDILIDKSSLTTAKSVLKEAGFLKGRMDRRAGQFIFWSREDEVRRELNTHESVPMRRLSGQPFFLNCYSIDLNFLFSWVGIEVAMTDLEAITKAALDSRIYRMIGDYKLPVCSDEYDALHTIWHTYNHATYFLSTSTEANGFEKNYTKDAPLRGIYESCCAMESLNVAEIIARHPFPVITKVIKYAQFLRQIFNIDDNQSEDIYQDYFIDESKRQLFWSTSLPYRMASDFDRKTEVDNLKLL